MDDALPHYRDALATFEHYLALHDLTLNTMTARQGLDAVLAFYRKQRFSIDGEDWLLFQYGISKYSYDGLYYLDFTRQFAVNASDDGEIWQMHLSFLFTPMAEISALGSDSGDWCESWEAEALAFFEDSVGTTLSYQALADAKPTRVELDFEDAC